MKIRLDFVTNSSSTSFMIVSLGSRDIERIMEQLRHTHPERKDSDRALLADVAEEHGFVMRTGEGGWYEGSIYLGWNPSCLEDMSIKEARLALAAAAKKAFDLDIDPTVIDLCCEGWYDG